jgi:pentapeptide MXKDX repeat protein
MFVRNRYLAGKRWSLKQSGKLLHRVVSNFDTPLHSNTRVFLYTGWDGTGRDGTGRDGMGCHATGRDAMGWDATGRDAMGRDGTGRHMMGQDGMGRNGMALSHSNAWPGTASRVIFFMSKCVYFYWDTLYFHIIS